MYINIFKFVYVYTCICVYVYSVYMYIICMHIRLQNPICIANLRYTAKNAKRLNDKSARPVSSPSNPFFDVYIPFQYWLKSY